MRSRKVELRTRRARPPRAEPSARAKRWGWGPSAVRNPLDVMLFGSTTQHVVRHAECPVLTISEGN